MAGVFQHQCMRSLTSIKEILLCDDDDRLDQLVQMFSKYQMAGKRHEKKAWHAYFRRIANNSVAAFYEDNQHDGETFLVTEPSCIHGDLHIGQFHYHVNDINQQQIFHIRHHGKVIAPFTWDLKRLATNLALIGYCHGFSDIEITEVLQAFTRQYIRSITKGNKTDFTRNNSTGDEQVQQVRPRSLSKQMSVQVSIKVRPQTYEIDWQSTKTVASLMILGEQIANAIADSHCKPPIHTFARADMMENKSDRHRQIIQTTLSTNIKQYELMNKSCLFAVTYTEIAERDHRLFFRHYRNERKFQDMISFDSTHIQNPLADARRVSILIVGGGTATALKLLHNPE